jgi:hypothetical protein
MQIPCVYIPGPAPAVSVANTKYGKSLIEWSVQYVHAHAKDIFYKSNGKRGRACYFFTTL